MKQENWTQQLHDKLAEHETAPPADLWTDIEAALPPQQHTHFAPLRRWLVAACVLSVLFLGCSMLWWMLHQPTEQPFAQTDSMKEEFPITVQEENLLAQTPNNRHIEERLLRSTPPSYQPRHDIPLSALPDSAHSRSAQRDSFHRKNEMHSTERTEHFPQKEHEASPNKNCTLSTERTGSFPQEDLSTINHKQTTITLYATNGLASYHNSNAVFMSEALVQNYTILHAQAARRKDPIYLSGYEEEQHHCQPVAIGLSLSYPLTKRLAITSGMIYSRLNSEFTQHLRNQHYTQKQTLYYLGIPVGLTYQLWKHNNFRCYLAANMQADWNVSMKMENEGVEQITGHDRMQWSVSGSLGLQYDLLPQMSLFAEPGISHYFDNGSSVQNFFKDKPTSLKLQAGLRISFNR